MTERVMIPDSPGYLAWVDDTGKEWARSPITYRGVADTARGLLTFHMTPTTVVIKKAKIPKGQVRRMRAVIYDLGGFEVMGQEMWRARTFRRGDYLTLTGGGLT